MYCLRPTHEKRLDLRIRQHQHVLRCNRGRNSLRYKYQSGHLRPSIKTHPSHNDSGLGLCRFQYKNSQKERLLAMELDTLQTYPNPFKYPCNSFAAASRACSISVSVTLYLSHQFSKAATINRRCWVM